jgi:hypothetical protein
MVRRLTRRTDFYPTAPESLASVSARSFRSL